MNAKTFTAPFCCLMPLIVANLALAQSSSLNKSEQISEGKVLFALYCASCHGADARGGGPVAEEMKTPPPSLREIAKRDGGAFTESGVISYIDGRNMPRAHGSSDMPVWGTLFGYVAEAGKLLDPKQQPIPHRVQQNIASIAKYLESIQEQ
jgi:mono/diheme cytochrome c family protein